MADQRGYNERDHQRISRAVLKSERDAGGPLPGAQGATPRPQKRLRVKLQGTCSQTTETTGVVQVENADGDDWVDTETIIPQIKLGHPDQSELAADDIAWIISHRGRWYVDSNAGCTTRNEIWIISIFGNPTGGTWELKSVTINGVASDITFNYNTSAASAQTALEGHAQLASGDVTVTGGDSPTASLVIEFTGDQAGTRIPPAIPDTTSLTGGTGVGIILARYQSGHPNE